MSEHSWKHTVLQHNQRLSMMNAAVPAVFTFAVSHQMVVVLLLTVPCSKAARNNWAPQGMHRTSSECLSLPVISSCDSGAESHNTKEARQWRAPAAQGEESPVPRWAVFIFCTCERCGCFRLFLTVSALGMAAPGNPQQRLWLPPTTALVKTIVKCLSMFPTSGSTIYCGHSLDHFTHIVKSRYNEIEGAQRSSL